MILILQAYHTTQPQPVADFESEAGLREKDKPSQLHTSLPC